MRLHARLSEKLAMVSADATALVPLLQRRSAELGLNGETDRLRTARSAEALVQVLQGKGAADQVRVLAAYEPVTSGAALGRHLFKGADATKDTPHPVRGLLSDALLFGVFAQLRTRSGELAGAAEILEKAQAAMRQDEINAPLTERLRELAVAGQGILSPPAGPTPPPPNKKPEPQPISGMQVVAEARAQAEGRAAIDKAVAEFENAVKQGLAEGAERLVLDLNWTLRRKG